jgi:leucyl aminopeptidase
VRCLTYAERYKPQSVVDIATLTGANYIIDAIENGAFAFTRNSFSLSRNFTGLTNGSDASQHSQVSL